MKSQYAQLGRGAADTRPRVGAFTLVEIMVLITVIGLLSVTMLAILWPRASSLGGPRARVQAAKSQINAFKTALDMFKEDNGHYPRGANGLNHLVKRPWDANDWHQYLDSIPPDPWGNEYLYEFPGRHVRDGFDLLSMGPDGKAGTKDDITNWQPQN
jgi:general secretion pathway protein G